MKNCLRNAGAKAHAFWREEQGQDLIEHALLVAFVALVSATLYLGASGKVNTVWNVANHTLANAANAPSQAS